LGNATSNQRSYDALCHAAAEQFAGKQALKASLIRCVGWWQDGRSRFVLNPDRAALMSLAVMRLLDTVSGSKVSGFSHENSRKNRRLASTCRQALQWES
jgi:hypothetical protein